MNQTTDTKETQPRTISSDCCASRQSGKAVLKDAIFRLRQKARNLETILNMLPEQPTPEQDEALWTTFVELR